MIRDSKEVRKTQDYLLQQEISMYEDKKIPVFIECLAKVNDKLKLSISDGINKITKTGVIVEVANKCEMTTDRIKKQLEKLGNTPFKVPSLPIVVTIRVNHSYAPFKLSSI